MLPAKVTIPPTVTRPEPLPGVVSSMLKLAPDASVKSEVLVRNVSALMFKSPAVCENPMSSRAKIAGTTVMANGAGPLKRPK